MNLDSARAQMIKQQLRTWEVLDSRVLSCLEVIPREAFVPDTYKELAFADTRIPLGHDQLMMTPKVEGRMLQALALDPDDTVLEIGTGSGFITACLAHLAGNVSSIDIYPDFTEKSRAKLEQLGKTNIDLETGDAMQLDADARYDAIAITGSLPVLDTRFERALRVGGRLFVICGSSPVMDAMLVTRTADDQWRRQSLFETDLPALLNSEMPPQFEF
jgi:protein-L-isoaspartate(D-aspartate) O-methyltransferase